MGLKESGLRGSIRNVSTGIGAAITIDTLEAENVDVDSATIRGEITELTNFGEDAEVFFEWGETTQGLPNTTNIQLQDTVGVFTEDLTNLSEDTTHEFQAFGSVRDVSDEGVVLTFETGAAIPDSGMFQSPIYHFSYHDVDDSDGAQNFELPEILAELPNATAEAGDPTFREDEDGVRAGEYSSARHEWSPDAQLPTGNDSFSLAALVKPTELSDDHTIISWGNTTDNEAIRLRLIDNSPGEVEFLDWATWSRPSASIPIDEWITVGAIWDGNDASVVVNGEIEDTNSEGELNLQDENHAIADDPRLDVDDDFRGFIGDIVVSDTDESESAFSDYHNFWMEQVEE